MTNPLTAEEIAVLHTELQDPKYAGLTNEQIADALSSPSQVPNSAPAGMVAKPYAAADLMGLLSSASLKSFFALPVAPKVVDAINAKDTANVLLWVAAAAKVGAITVEEATAVASRLAETYADPQWPATVPGPRPVETLFGQGKTWTLEGTGASIDYVPVVAIQGARN